MRRKSVLSLVRHSRRSATRFYAFLATLIITMLACSRADAPINYRNITPLAGVPGPGVATTAPGGPTATLVPASPPVPGVPTATLRPTQDTSASPTPDALRPSAL